MSFIHDAIDRRRCNTRGRPSTISVDHTNTPENGQCLREGTFPLNISLSDIFRTLTCDGIRQEVLMLRWTHENQFPHELPGGLQSGFALHLVVA